VPLGPYFVMAKAFNAVGRFFGAVTVFGNERWQRSSSREIGKETVLEVCKEAGLEEGVAEALFTAALKNETHVLERCEKKECVQFAQLFLQDYLAAAHLYTSPGDDPTIKSVWDSLASYAISTNDMLGDVRQNFLMMVAAKSPRPEGAHQPLYRLQVSARDSNVGVAGFLLREGQGKADSCDDVMLSAITSFLFARRSDLVPMLTTLARYMNFTDVSRVFGYMLATFIVVLSHCSWLLGATALIATSKGDFAPFAAVPAAAFLLSLVTLLEKMNPLRYLLSFWVLAVWTVQSWINFLLMPPALVFGLVFAALCVAASVILFPVLIVFFLYQAPILSQLLGRLGHWAKILAIVFLAFGNVLSIVLLALQSNGIDTFGG